MTTSDMVFKAIAHPARREIISLLSTSTLSVKELTSAFEMSQPAVSQHLRELKEARIVQSERVGLEQRYHLTGAPLKVVAKWADQYRRFFDPSGHAWQFVSVPADAAATLADHDEKKKKKKGRRHGR